MSRLCRGATSEAGEVALVQEDAQELVGVLLRADAEAVADALAVDLGPRLACRPRDHPGTCSVLKGVLGRL